MSRTAPLWHEEWAIWKRRVDDDCPHDATCSSIHTWGIFDILNWHLSSLWRVQNLYLNTISGSACELIVSSNSWCYWPHPQILASKYFTFELSFVCSSTIVSVNVLHGFVELYQLIYIRPALFFHLYTGGLWVCSSLSYSHHFAHNT